ncbi:MAG: hypothetical protein J7647_13710 [Cyanobacteria bacterium SBLK]|nr:hypothetical protein [Cyanobacteria bacterium SBLK]
MPLAIAYQFILGVFASSVSTIFSSAIAPITQLLLQVILTHANTAIAPISFISIDCLS